MIPYPLPFCGDIIEANPIVTARGEKIGDMGIFSIGFNCYEPGILRFTNSLRIRPAPSRCRECPPSGVLRAKARWASAVGRGESGHNFLESLASHERKKNCYTTFSRQGSDTTKVETMKRSPSNWIYLLRLYYTTKLKSTRSKHSVVSD
jgi:hypothetical protein